MSNFIHTKNQTPVNLDHVKFISFQKEDNDKCSISFTLSNSINGTFESAPRGLIRISNTCLYWEFKDMEEGLRVYNEIIKLHSQEI